MIETPPLDLNVPLGLNVARGTSSYSTGNAFLLPFGSSLIKMTDETVGFMNGEMQSLDKLGMASGAPKVHPPSQFTQMSPMGKTHILKYHIPFQIISDVTSLLQTVMIINFVMKFQDPFSNHKIRDGQLEIAPFSFEMI
jgi:hypothetical protein